jgi:hypothetical protein
MPASYPNSVKVFTTKTTGQTILASHINEPQDEITAIEQGLLQGLEHALFPKTDVGQDLGTTTKRWRNLLVQKIAASQAVIGTDPGGTELLRAQSLRAGSGIVGSWRPIGVIQTTSNVGSVVFSELNLSPPALLRLVAVIRPIGTGIQNYHLLVNNEANSDDWAEQLFFASGTTVGGSRTVDSSRIANFDDAGNFSVTHCSVTIVVDNNGSVRASSVQSFADAQDTPLLAQFGLVKNTTISTLSSLAVVGGIASGSVFYLEYLGP